MPNVVSSDLYMFADDTKLHCTITSESDCNILDNVIDWGNTQLTNFNLHKCKVLSWYSSQYNIMRNIYSMSCTSEEHQLNGIEEENDLHGYLTVF